MKKYINGILVEFASEEAEVIRKQGIVEQAKEKARPLTEAEVFSLLLAQKVQEIEVDDETALRMMSYYPEWEPGKTYPVGHKLTRNGKLYKVIQSHTAQTGWEPETVPAMFTEICETHSGEMEDPIPYSGNMALEEGKHYVQEDVIYLCTRDSINPVYHALRELTGLYVEIA